MTDHGPWLAVAGFGVFHGLNPAMGWLFAVALGLHRGGLATVVAALAPIAIGHAASVALMAAAFVASGQLIEARALEAAAGLLLIGWGLYLILYGHRGRVRFGLQAGITGLFLWSFLMATAHGAGLMLIPSLGRLCLPVGSAHPVTVGLAAVGLHTAAMLIVTGVVATTVYKWIGLAILRTTWINLDALWTAALLAIGTLLLLG
ncbi:MAG TPA: hypothetical protein VE665_07830 [Hyphomicrobiaceae bacterium]|jgi:hypothetical protein|nr:hypothetical protein [Hyphomicrobiaceae bacterium]